MTQTSPWIWFVTTSRDGLSLCRIYNSIYEEVCKDPISLDWLENAILLAHANAGTGCFVGRLQETGVHLCDNGRIGLLLYSTGHKGEHKTGQYQWSAFACPGEPCCEVDNESRGRRFRSGATSGR